ncbi:hypothetical protein BDV09DRAFT_166642 [Aspergillus tetrazonus]
MMSPFHHASVLFSYVTGTCCICIAAYRHSIPTETCQSDSLSHLMFSSVINWRFGCFMPMYLVSEEFMALFPTMQGVSERAAAWD